jgi:hypothetical protein
LIVERITTILTPHLGAFSADAVARHVCAKLEIGESADAEQLAKLQEFLRRGLVAYVGASAAQELAAKCVKEAPGGLG